MPQFSKECADQVNFTTWHILNMNSSTSGCYSHASTALPDSVCVCVCTCSSTQRRGKVLEVGGGGGSTDDGAGISMHTLGGLGACFRGNFFFN